MESLGKDLAEIVVSRDAEYDIKIRGLEIYLDDQFVFDLEYERSYRVRVPAGMHKIHVTNRLYKKAVTVEAKAGETVKLLAGNRFTLLGGLMVSILGMGPYRVFLELDTRDEPPQEPA